MEKEKKDRLDELNAKLRAQGLTGSEKEEHRLLHMEFLAEMMEQQMDEDDE